MSHSFTCYLTLNARSGRETQCSQRGGLHPQGELTPVSAKVYHKVANGARRRLAGRQVEWKEAKTIYKCRITLVITLIPSILRATVIVFERQRKLKRCRRSGLLQKLPLEILTEVFTEVFNWALRKAFFEGSQRRLTRITVDHRSLWTSMVSIPLRLTKEESSIRRQPLDVSEIGRFRYNNLSR